MISKWNNENFNIENEIKIMEKLVNFLKKFFIIFLIF